MKPAVLCTLVLLASAVLVAAQEAKPKPEDTEVWKPIPPVVTPGATSDAPSSDAIILFDGKNEDEWVSAQDHTPAKWVVAQGLLTVAKGTGNSGVFLASTGPGDDGYELQVLDPWNNPTYVNGMAGSLYKQAIPLVNPGRKPGEWQTYDVVWTAPIFNDDGSLKTPAYATVFFNGVLVENHFALKGQTLYIGQPFYKKYDRAPIKLQAHGDKSAPLSFRNIWVRELP
jgi:hypothetical protein